MTKYETNELKNFLLEVGCGKYDFNPDGTPTPADKITLYNPLLPLHTLFHVFECFQRPTRRLDNVVDRALLKEGFDCEHRHSTQYFFQVPVPGFHVEVLNKTNMTGLTYHLQHAKHETMTAAEAILYLLFYQFRNEPQPFPCPIVTLTTTKSMKVPLVVGFDEEDICNKIQLYNANQAQPIVTKEVKLYTRR